MSEKIEIDYSDGPEEALVTEMYKLSQSEHDDAPRALEEVRLQFDKLTNNDSIDFAIYKVHEEDVIQDMAIAEKQGTTIEKYDALRHKKILDALKTRKKPKAKKEKNVGKVVLKAEVVDAPKKSYVSTFDSPFYKKAGEKALY